jgi:hypothetical protein
VRGERIGEKLKYRKGGYRFPGSGFSNESKRLALIELERHMFDSVERSIRRFEADGKIIH